MIDDPNDLGAGFKIMSPLSKALTIGLLTGILGVGLFPVANDLEEGVGLDLLFRLRGARNPPSNAVVVTMDRVSANRLKLPPEPEEWPRSLHAHLIDTLVQGGAIVIAFDIMFDRARSSEEDQQFSDAISRARNVVLCECLQKVAPSMTDESKLHSERLNIERLVSPIPILANRAVALAPFPLPKVPVKVSQYWTFKAGAGDRSTLPTVAFQIFTLDVYEEFIQLLEKVGTSVVGQLPRNKESLVKGKAVERTTQILRDAFQKEPSIAKEMLQALKDSKSGFVDKNRARIIRSLIHLYGGANSRYLNFYGPPGTITTVPFYQMLQTKKESPDDLKPADVSGKAVFIGLSERLRPEQKDGFHTVFSQPDGLDIGGVEIAATAFANLSEDMPVRPIAFSYNLAILLFWGLLLGILSFLFPTYIAALSILLVAALYLSTAQYLFNHSGIWSLLIIPLLIQLPSAFFGTVLWKYTDTSKERENIKKAFGFFLPDKVVDELAKNLGDLKTNGQIVYGTCLSTDAEQYTALSETMSPGELSNFINRYYEAVFMPVRSYGGTVSDVIGDSMLAIWATAQPDTEVRNRACLAALDIAKAVERFNQASENVKLPTRIGLHSGQMLLGNIGAIDHYEYRPVGDIVNTVSRIEGLNKYLGTRQLVSGNVIFQLDGFLTRQLGRFVLAGKSKPIAVHELICCLDESNSQQRQLCAVFSEALDAFLARCWDEAICGFSESCNIIRGDGPSSYYMKLCEKYRDMPPGDMWNGIIHLDNK